MNTSRVRMLARWIGALFALLALVSAAADPPPHAEEEPLSLNFQDIDVRAALRIIANAADFNLVASEAVSGRVTLRLEEVAWEQALELVLQVCRARPAALGRCGVRGPGGGNRRRRAVPSAGRTADGGPGAGAH